MATTSSGGPPGRNCKRDRVAAGPGAHPAAQHGRIVTHRLQGEHTGF
ncbi:MAG TPA: hypothetical protein VF940_04675 [Streptosporangiaceae bacterium]